MNSLWKKLRQLTLLAPLGLLLIATGCVQDGPEAEGGAAANDVIVLGERDVATVTQGVLEQGIAVTGTLEPYLRVDVKAQVPGTLGQVRVDEGEAVRKGSVMATIDAQGIRSQAASARAAVASAEANLALARRELESAKTLYDAGAMSAIAYEQAKTAYESAEAQLSAAKSQAAGASEQASRTTVNAPISGVVSSRTVEAGEAVNPGQSLFTVVNTQILELAGKVPVTAARFIKVGQPVVFTLDAYPGQSFRGTVARIEPTADPESRQLGVYLRMPNPGANIVGGLFATGRVISSEAPSAPLVPAPAIRGTQGSRYVLVVDDGQIDRRPVTVTARDDDRGLVAVDSTSLAPGDVVLVSPTAEIQEGAKVRVAAE
ncbi:MAG TPA: efflux RND transporter periplasmic adaptor subunit [Rhodothermales bacterium]|nr:efflux RND transporter periplasmic adaptor subunit [Rhodothermales bacterium]